jgi:hypothetical protein
MARRKTPPLTVQSKHALAERIMALRMDLFGARGGPELARRLGIPVRTWYNYEGGITVPGEILLKIIEVTTVNPMWLLHGTGRRLSEPSYDPTKTIPSSAQMQTNVLVASALKRERHVSMRATVCTLLRAALQLLDEDQTEASDDDGAPQGPPALHGQVDEAGPEARFLERSGRHNSQASGTGTG